MRKFSRPALSVNLEIISVKILLSGGGTLGPVSPLLAIAETYRQYDPTVNLLWVGTKNGPERKLIEEQNIPFIAIRNGKWRRYLSLLNIVDLFRLVAAFIQSYVILLNEKPDLLISAGGYVSVPLHAAAALFGIPCWVHQQDVGIGLANKLMFVKAKKITAALKETAEKLPKNRSEWIGNPARELEAGDRLEARRRFNIPAEAPVIFVFGGGTGSNHLNQLILAAMPQLNPAWHVIHVVGRDRSGESSEKTSEIFSNYHAYKFFTEEMKDAYAIADVVVARAGFGTLTELAALSKAAIILPMIGTHQEENARYFAGHGGIIMLDQASSSLKLAQAIRELLESEEKRQELGNRLHVLLPITKPEKIVEIILKIR